MGTVTTCNGSAAVNHYLDYIGARKRFQSSALFMYERPSRFASHADGSNFWRHIDLNLVE
jgi:hypothetical protein